MGSEKGKMIGTACEILRQVYQEIDHMSDEVGDLLSEYAPGLKFHEEYSYGPKSLFLKANHSYIFRKEEEGEDPDDKDVFAMVVIFDDRDDDLKRINLRDEPELWFASARVLNRKEKLSPWDVSWLLSPEERGCFEGQTLRIGGAVSKYRWVDDKAVAGKREEWIAKLIGYPLVDMTDRETIREKIFERLFVQSD